MSLVYLLSHWQILAAQFWHVGRLGLLSVGGFECGSCFLVSLCFGVVFDLDLEGGDWQVAERLRSVGCFSVS